jgi:hypothetical protein
MYLLEVALIWVACLVFIQGLVWVLYVRGEEPQHPSARFVAGRETHADLPTMRPPD